MNNQDIANLFEELASRLEINGDNPFRIRAIRRASEIMESQGQDVLSLDRKDLLSIEGVGKGIADMVEELKAKGKISDLEDLRKKIPQGVMELLNISGLGPKRAALLYQKKGIDSPKKLAEALKKGALKDVSGFGKKLEESLLKNLAYAESDQGRVLLKEARDIAEQIVARMKEHPAVEECQAAGSLRRWKETCGDLDILCQTASSEKVMDHFLADPNIIQKLSAGPTKSSVVYKPGVQVDFRVTPKDSFGAALLYFTGSKEHNVRLREIAQKKNFLLNEYGLFKTSDAKRKKPVAARTEKEIYQKLGMAWIPPELREDRGEVKAALANTLPNLIQEKDIKGDFHNHTDWSDGADTLEDMTLAAEKKGWAWFFSADHSPSLTVANGLNHARLIKKKKELAEIQKKRKKIRLFLGSEVDILAEGQLDYDDKSLKEIDAVVGSVHSRFSMGKEEMTERIIRAIQNPRLKILGHLTGRLLKRREGYSVDYEAIFDAAIKHNVAIEINGQPKRMELADGLVKRAIEKGVLLSVNTDAHSKDQLANMTFAVGIARRGWAEKKNVINARALKDIQQWLKK